MKGEQAQTRFSHLEITGWRQIEHVSLAFHPRLTIITGANGAGKTTLLTLLADHFGWESEFVSTPMREQKRGVFHYFAGLWHDVFSRRHSMLDQYDWQGIVGTVMYENAEFSLLGIPQSTGPTYKIAAEPRRQVRGLYIPSHRPLYSYQPINAIQTNPITRDEAFVRYSTAVRARFSDDSFTAPNYSLKQTLLSLATFGFGNPVVESDPSALRLFKDFETILAAVLPPKLGFERLVIRMPEVVLVTRSGEFSLDAVSGGVASIIDMAWQIFLYAPSNKPFVVVIDEPENHLHPELQRTILPNFLDAFPRVQFIVATHNPFIVTSVPDSQVYVLDFHANHRVRSTLLSLLNRAGTSNEILRDVLGLETAMPLWVERELQRIVHRYEEQELSSKTFDALRNELSQIGLAKYVPETIADLAGRRHDPA